MEQFDSSVEESSKVSEQQQRNDEQQCPNCAAELTETSVSSDESWNFSVPTYICCSSEMMMMMM